MKKSKLRELIREEINLHNGKLIFLHSIPISKELKSIVKELNNNNIEAKYNGSNGITFRIAVNKGEYEKAIAIIKKHKNLSKYFKLE